MFDGPDDFEDFDPMACFLYWVGVTIVILAGSLGLYLSIQQMKDGWDGWNWQNIWVLLLGCAVTYRFVLGNTTDNRLWKSCFWLGGISAAIFSYDPLTRDITWEMLWGILMAIGYWLTAEHHVHRWRY